MRTASIATAERNHEILDKIADGRTLTELSDEYKISKQRIHQIAKESHVSREKIRENARLRRIRYLEERRETKRSGLNQAKEDAVVRFKDTDRICREQLNNLYTLSEAHARELRSYLNKLGKIVTRPRPPTEEKLQRIRAAVQDRMVSKDSLRVVAARHAMSVFSLSQYIKIYGPKQHVQDGPGEGEIELPMEVGQATE